MNILAAIKGHEQDHSTDVLFTGLFTATAFFTIAWGPPDEMVQVNWTCEANVKLKDTVTDNQIIEGELVLL